MSRDKFMNHDDENPKKFTQNVGQNNKVFFLDWSGCKYITTLGYL